MKILKNTTVVDVVERQLIENVDIVVSGDKIKAIQPTKEYSDCKDIIDATGKYVIPGMIDMHGHFFTAMRGCYISIPGTAARLYLSNGITTVCSKGELSANEILSLKSSVNSGDATGPGILTAGRIINGPPKLSDAFETCTSPEEILSAYKKQKEGIDLVKVYEYTPYEFVRILVDEAHKDGLKVYGHLGACTARDAILAGIDGLEHGVFNMSEFWEALKEGEKKPSPLRLASFDPDSEETEKLVELIVEHDVAITPTISTVQLLFGQNLDWFDEKDIWSMYESGLGEQLRDAYIQATTNEPYLTISACADRAIEKQNKMMASLINKGGRILAGTDPSVPYVLGGMNICKEAINIKMLGLSKMDVLRALTIEAARELTIQEITGSIEPGKNADMVLLENNPLDDLSNLENIYLVIKDGVSYCPKDLKASAKNTIPLATGYGMTKRY